MQCTFSGSTDSSIRRSVAVKESLKGELNYMSENDYKLKYESNQQHVHFRIAVRSKTWSFSLFKGHIQV